MLIEAYSTRGWFTCNWTIWDHLHYAHWGLQHEELVHLQLDNMRPATFTMLIEAYNTRSWFTCNWTIWGHLHYAHWSLQHEELVHLQLDNMRPPSLCSLKPTTRGAGLLATGQYEATFTMLIEAYSTRSWFTCNWTIWGHLHYAHWSPQHEELVHLQLDNMRPPSLCSLKPTAREAGSLATGQYEAGHLHYAHWSLQHKGVVHVNLRMFSW